MKLVPVILLFFVAALASADIVPPNSNINRGDTALKHISQLIKDAPSSDIVAEENEEDAIVDEDSINELDQVRSEESEIEGETAVKDDDLDKDSAVKQGVKKAWGWRRRRRRRRYVNPCAGCQNSLKILNQKYNALLHKYNKQVAYIRTLIAKYNNLVSRCKAAIARLNKVIKGLVIKYNILVRKYRGLVKKYNILAKKYNQLLAYTRRLIAKYNNLVSQCKTIIARLNSKVKVWQQKYNILVMYNRNLTTQHHNLKSQYQAVVQENKNLTTINADQATQIQNLTIINANQAAQIKSLQAQLQNAANQNLADKQNLRKNVKKLKWKLYKTRYDLDKCTVCCNSCTNTPKKPDGKNTTTIVATNKEESAFDEFSFDNFKKK